jgi:hypothetical protein
MQTQHPSPTPGLFQGPLRDPEMATMADKYRKMYRAFEPIRRTLMGTTPLSTDQLIRVLKAAKAEPGNDQPVFRHMS